MNKKQIRSDEVVKNQGPSPTEESASNIADNTFSKGGYLHSDTVKVFQEENPDEEMSESLKAYLLGLY